MFKLNYGKARETVQKDLIAPTNSTKFPVKVVALLWYNSNGLGRPSP
jgi:hypothetical protein